MKAIRQFLLFLVVSVAAGCAHPGKIAGLYVPGRCIEKVSWTKPCATVSEHLVKCDAVMVSTTCVAASTTHSNHLEQNLSAR